MTWENHPTTQYLQPVANIVRPRSVWLLVLSVAGLPTSTTVYSSAPSSERKVALRFLELTAFFGFFFLRFIGFTASTANHAGQLTYDDEDVSLIHCLRSEILWLLCSWLEDESHFIISSVSSHVNTNIEIIEMTVTMWSSDNLSALCVQLFFSTQLYRIYIHSSPLLFCSRLNRLFTAEASP